jgi:hypothetical protein
MSSSATDRLRRRRGPAGLALVLPALVAAGAAPVAAHTDSPASLPLKPRAVRLEHRSPADVVLLFAREARPDPAGGPGPRAARSDSAGSLLADGTQALYRGAAPNELVIVASGDSAGVEACIRQLDVPVEAAGPDLQRIAVTLRRANPRVVSTAILRLPGGGSATVLDSRLVLIGKPGWLHRALRSVIRAELGLSEPSATP